MNDGIVSVSRIEIRRGSRVLVPSVVQIGEAVFGGTSVIDGAHVSAEDFMAAGIRYSRFVAMPRVVIEPCSLDPTKRVRFRVVGVHSGHEAPIAYDDSLVSLGYVIINNWWYPVAQDAMNDIERLAGASGVTIPGAGSLTQYVRVLRWRDEEVDVSDRTGGAVEPTRIGQALTLASPSRFRGTLYPYQTDGYKWLSFMAECGTGCILADEMGLGKTIQVICMLLRQSEISDLPHLVICPATLLENWRRELVRFAPGVDVLVHRGAQRTGFPNRLRAYDIVLSSYDTARADFSLLSEVEWGVVVLDEAQNIRNPLAQRTQRIKMLHRAVGIAVTGTPVENRLRDLWSISDFCLPGLLGSLDEFEHTHPDTTDAAAVVEPVISPFILRRLVEDVAADLPDKIEIPQVLHMDSGSAAGYEALRQGLCESTSESELAVITRLRMFCAHPWLVEDREGGYSGVSEDATRCSSKLTRLVEIVDELALSSDKALVFVSFRQAADIVCSTLAELVGTPVFYIDGRVPVVDRQRLIDQFSSRSGSAVLVLNPKAAGTGLNISAANHVIHYTPEWNPAVQDQATARAYRRGQTRVVTVHALYYAATVEEVMYDRMMRKRELASAAIVGVNGKQQTIEDVRRALLISPLGNGQEA